MGEEGCVGTGRGKRGEGGYENGVKDGMGENGKRERGEGGEEKRIESDLSECSRTGR